MAAYNVSKHGVVTLSETLHKDLALSGAPIRVSVLCPGFVDTRIAESARNRPAELRAATPRPRPESIAQALRTNLPTGLAPTEVARRVLEAVRAEQFYVLTDPHWAVRVRTRSDEILKGRTPNPSPSFR
jgi:NAD(P)-dependent dehydrogenase (short-subunit alcohol dehydrogenase family)